MELNVLACELLSMVRMHSRSLVEARGDDEETSDVEMDSRFWNRVFDLYFVRGRVSKGREEDDMIFFVKNMVKFVSYLFFFSKEMVCVVI